MSFIEDLKKTVSGESELLSAASSDNLGGRVLDSDIYVMKIKDAYLTKSNGGATGAVLIFDNDGSEFRQTLWITNKEGIPYFEKDGKKRPLPGWALLNDLTLLVTDTPLENALDDTKEQAKMVYNVETQKEEPQNLPTLVNLIGKETMLGVLKVTEYKREQGGDGKWYDSSETRTINTIDKFFDPQTQATLNEIETYEGPEDEFQPRTHNKWLSKWQGKEKDTTKNSKGNSSSSSGSSSSSSNFTPAPAKQGGLTARRSLRRN